MLSILAQSNIKKMKTSTIVWTMIAAAAAGFSGMALLIALHHGVFVPALWSLLMLVVYLPVVSIVCKKEGDKKLWRRRVALSFIAFSVFALITGVGLVLIFN